MIELGCCDLSRYCLDLFIMGADSYIGVDPFYLPDAEKARKWLVDIGFKQAKDKSIEYVPRDALSYLEMLPEGNEIVIFSSGTLESSIIHDKQYARELVRQIARLTNLNNPSTIHVVDEFFAKLFREEGLLLDFGRTIPCNDFIIGLYKRAQPK